MPGLSRKRKVVEEDSEGEEAVVLDSEVIVVDDEDENEVEDEEIPIEGLWEDEGEDDEESPEWVVKGHEILVEDEDDELGWASDDEDAVVDDDAKLLPQFGTLTFFLALFSYSPQSFCSRRAFRVQIC
jgi:hypothetical protein